MSRDNIFSKHLPNIKLDTRFEADGREIQVEIREDDEHNAKQLEIFDILVAAGYFRAKIKGLSPFEKIVGGMVWCIEACDVDVDVDLLFQENLTIGMKLPVTERIVQSLIRMKCPIHIAPHQIQGLDYINIFPVIQWLVKRSVENRAEKAEKLKRFATGQFHNYFELKSEIDLRDEYTKRVELLRHILMTYGPRRQYRRKEDIQGDEATHVRITLLEYGQMGGRSFGRTNTSKGDQTKNDDAAAEEDVGENEEIPEEGPEIMEYTELSEAERAQISQAMADLRSEMSYDSKGLSEHNKLKNLMAMKIAMEKKSHKLRNDNENLEKIFNETQIEVTNILGEQDELRKIIAGFENSKTENKDILEKVETLVAKNEKLKQEELKCRETFKQEAANLLAEIKKAEEYEPESSLEKLESELSEKQTLLQKIRLQLAKQNRGILTIQRQLDNIPDRTELSQYQKRFIELYNQVSAKHKETKQFYTLYNTLDDTKLYLTKELSLLNSIFENYNEAMNSQHTMDEYLNQFEKIVDGIRQTKVKVKGKLETEKSKRDGLNEVLLSLVEQERKYALAVKQLATAYQRSEQYSKKLKALGSPTVK